MNLYPTDWNYHILKRRKSVSDNISPDDYGEKFDSGDLTPYYSEQTLENNPTITTKYVVELKLALNTAQIA